MNMQAIYEKHNIVEIVKTMNKTTDYLNSMFGCRSCSFQSLYSDVHVSKTEMHESVTLTKSTVCCICGYAALTVGKYKWTSTHF